MSADNWLVFADTLHHPPLKIFFLDTLEVQQILRSELHAVISFLFLFCPLLNSTLPLKKRSLWSLERALSFPLLPPHHLAPERQGSTLRLWSTAPKTLTLLTLKVPFGALSPTPVSIYPPLPALSIASYFKELKPMSGGLHECVHVKQISKPFKKKILNH